MTLHPYASADNTLLVPTNSIHQESARKRKSRDRHGLEKAVELIPKFSSPHSDSVNISVSMHLVAATS